MAYPYNVPADKWPLSTRAKNVFRDMGIRSFHDLLMTDAQDLWREPKIGYKTMAEIKAFVSHYGHDFIDSWQWNLPEHRRVEPQMDNDHLWLLRAMSV